MNWIKKVLLALLVILAIFLVAGLIIKQQLKPEYKGEKSLPGLETEVTVYYDTYGVPHIYAENRMDAFKALGYVHAQDRLWQMELLRRLAIGGISEIFGKDAIPTDRFFLTLGIDNATTRHLENIDRNSEHVAISEAYLEGINAFIESGPTPVEFLLTGLDKKPYTLRDIYNTLGYMAFNFAQAHKTDPVLSAIGEKLGPDYLADLELSVSPGTAFIKNHIAIESQSAAIGLHSEIRNILKGLPVPLLEGSNSWVIGPEKTSTGAVILANDPHIEFAQPSVWYEAHMVYPGYEKYGYHLGGIPFPLLGHDRNLAYGMTMFQNDDIDFYRVEQHPSDSSLYRGPEGWIPYQTRSKTIKVKDGDDETITVRSTRNGPLLNGIADRVAAEDPVSMYWIYTQLESDVLNAVYEISNATSLETFHQALPAIHAPGLNIMYGDAEGNIAWWATAKLYLLREGAESKLYLDGSSDSTAIVRFLDFTENPQAINPPWNYVYSANNQPDTIAGVQYPGYYLPENRARRIVDLLEPKSDWNSETVQEMIVDHVSPVDSGIAKNLVKWVNIKELSDTEIGMLDLLNTWDGSYNTSSVEATLYHRWIYYFLKNTFSDEIGDELFEGLLDTHLIKRVIAPMADKEESVWWDNVSTPDTVETRNDIIQVSLIDALNELSSDLGPDNSKWTWDRVHTLEHEHPIGNIKTLRSFFNVGPFPVTGAREVINNLAFPYRANGSCAVTSGPSTRRVIDFSDVENSVSILPTGQSGNPFSKHYEDQAKMYAMGSFRKMLINKDSILAHSPDVLKFQPAE